uniref:Uncharacterized protein n=1 Tax=Zonotrichia albicollis TaxID=44394 RepID=A0A8D2MDI3_ZONAL
MQQPDMSESLQNTSGTEFLPGTSTEENNVKCKGLATSASSYPPACAPSCQLTGSNADFKFLRSDYKQPEVLEILLLLLLHPEGCPQCSTGFTPKQRNPRAELGPQAPFPRPSEEELFFRKEEYTLKRRKQVTDAEKWEKRMQENWENCAELNLSFQDLGDLYQVENLKRILHRLIRVEKLWLVDNSLTDLSAIRLPRCRELNVNKNHFTSFKQLPKVPQIQHLSLAENNITSLSGISDFRHTPLESLILKRNPCEFQERYRQLVFSNLPNLKILDGIPKLPEDCSPPEGLRRCLPSGSSGSIPH